MSPSAVINTDPYRWRAVTWKTEKKWTKWETVGLAPTLDLGDLVLNWTDSRVIDLGVYGVFQTAQGEQRAGAITGIELERTIEGASTLTLVVRDPEGRLFSQEAKRTRVTAPTKRQKRRPVEVDEGWDPITPPDVVGRAMQVTLDGAVFRLVKVAYQHQSQEVTLTFEDRIVYLLRRKRGERRASRAKVTRAQFVLSLLREINLIKPPFVCPDLLVKQPIDKGETGRTTGAAAKASDGLIARVPAVLNRVYPRHRLGDKEAARLSERQVRAAAEYAGLSPTDALHAAQIAHGESNYYPGVVQDDPGDGMVGHGLWQMTPNAWGKGSATYKHMLSLGGLDAMRNPIQAARQMKWMFEQSGKSWRQWYGIKYLDLASKGTTVLGKGVESDIGATAEGAAAGNGSYAKSYQFAREPNEDSWTAIQRLASEVAWRCFVVGEAVYYMPEDSLYGRRPRYELTPESDALIDMSYDVDWGKPVSECTVQLNLQRWSAPPGAVMLLSGFGPPDGRWLVTAIRRDWFSPTAEVTLKQPGKRKLEPANERTERASSTTTQGSADGAADASASGRVYAEAKAISDRKLPYIWGGGHARCGTADAGTNTPAKNSGPPPGFDCSGYVCACLAAGGLGFKPGQPAMASGGLTNWGESGPGERITVWANAGHTFIEFTGMGAGKFADTGRNAAPPTDRGPRLRSGTRSTAGFTARHWPGT